MARRRSRADRPEFIDYGQWGRDFFADAVSQDRLLGAVDVLAGRPIDFGPVGVGPGKLAQIRADGHIGTASAEPMQTPEIAYRVALPVDLTFQLDLQVDTHSFHADLLVPLVLTARAASGVRIFIDVDPPRPDDVEVEVRADGFRASIMQRVTNVEGELRRFVSKYISRELTRPEIASARTIDVSRAIDRAWASISPQRAARAAEEFNDALRDDIVKHPEGYLDVD